MSQVLKSHKVTHGREKPISYDVCLKSFSLAGNLKRHKVTHGGENPTCVGFVTKDSLGLTD